MRASLVWACVGLASLCLAEPAVLPLRMIRNRERHAQALQRRYPKPANKRDAFPVILQNYPYIGGGFYFVNATVGTPAQEVQLQIDTGSSDVWIFGVGSCDSSTSLCAGGAFDESASTTLTVIEQGGFQIQYFTAGSGVTGDYVADFFTIGDQSIQNLTMGVATEAKSVNTGIMGIGFDTNEAIVATAEAQGESNVQPYPNLIDSLKQQGLISTRGYSLYLDDLNANTGSIVFGGYDKTKFNGDLGILAIQPDAQSGIYSSFGVVLNSVGVTDATGSTVLKTDNMPNVVILDSGTAFTILPPDLFSELVIYFGALNDETYSWIVRCDLGGMKGTLDYQFAGPNGPLVSVPFSELAVPIVDLNTGAPVTDSNNDPVCSLGLSTPSSANEPLLFGDTFLRSAYVVYDLDNLQIGLAQTIFDVTDSDIQALSATTTGQNLPGQIASLETTIVETKTQAIDGADAAETFVSTIPSAVNTAVGEGKGTAALTGYKTTYANAASIAAASGTGSTSVSTTSSAGASSTTSNKKNGAATLLPSRGWFLKGLITLLVYHVVIY